MPPTAEQTKQGYYNLWNEADVIKAAEADAIANKCIANKARYLEIEHKLGVPWIMVAAIHNRESSLSFNGHFHNGDPLTARTRQVPAGRPKEGSPPFTWEDSTEDAIKLKKLEKLKGQWTLERMLFEEEGYNGWGYLGKGNSPYIWAGTDIYSGGKYTRDHYYDPKVWDKQLGCAAVMKSLALKDESAKAWVAIRAIGMPADATKRATEEERKKAQAGAGTVVVGGGGTAAPVTDSPGGHMAQYFIGGAVLIIGLAICIVAGKRIAEKTQQVKERWGFA